MKFLAQIKTVNYKQLVSGDYSLQVTLQLDNPDHLMMAQLNDVNTVEGVVVELSPDINIGPQ